jgi:hypothetical protein
LCLSLDSGESLLNKRWPIETQQLARLAMLIVGNCIYDEYLDQGVKSSVPEPAKEVRFETVMITICISFETVLENTDLE